MKPMPKLEHSHGQKRKRALRKPVTQLYRVPINIAVKETGIICHFTETDLANPTEISIHHHSLTNNMIFGALITMSWFVLCSLWWLGALTIAIPLTLMLFVNKTFRSSFFSWFFVYIIGPIFQPRTIAPRRKVFQILKDSVSDRDKKVPLEVLEIGVGEGPNLQFYPENCNLTVLDKNKFFESYYAQNAKKFPHISYQRTVIQPAEKMSDIADSSLDVVISTYLHCSCDDSLGVLKEVRRVLKPGGKYVFLEHVCYPENEFGLSIQQFINPIWFLFFNGCTLDRNTASKIKRAGFSEVICDKYISPEFMMYLVRHQIIGVATK